MKPPITIVGPQTDEDGGTKVRGNNGKGNGLNALLIMAASDAEIRKRLLDDRESLLEEVGEQLTGEEVEMLREIPNGQLSRMIDGQRLGKDIRQQVFNAIKLIGIATALAAVIIFLISRSKTESDSKAVENNQEDIWEGSVHRGIIMDRRDTNEGASGNNNPLSR